MTITRSLGCRGEKLIFIGGLAALLVATASPARAAHYNVYTSSIPADLIRSNDNYCSLAEAIKSINDGVTVANCVDLDASNPGMITLIEAAGKPYASFHYVIGNTTMTLNKSIRIQPSEEGFTAFIDSSGPLAFKVNSTATDVNFYGLDIRHTGTGSGRVIWNAGTLSLGNVTVRNGNVTTEPLGKGGGIYNQGTLWGSNCQLLNNSAKRGGGLYNDDGKIPNLSVNIQGNTATMAGGGIYNNSTTTQGGRPKGYIGLSFSTIKSNTAKAGGGVFNRGEMDAVTTSITLNTASGTGSGETCHAGLSCDGFGAGVLTLTSTVQVAQFRINTSSAISSNKASGLGGAVYNTGQLNASGISIASNEAKSGAAIFAAALVDSGGAVQSNYCEVTGSTGASSITSNKTVPTGGYSIVDSSGLFGTYCLFVTAASGNAGPKYCAPAGVRPGTSCPQ